MSRELWPSGWVDDRYLAVEMRSWGYEGPLTSGHTAEAEVVAGTLERHLWVLQYTLAHKSKSPRWGPRTVTWSKDGLPRQSLPPAPFLVLSFATPEERASFCTAWVKGWGEEAVIA